MASTRRLWTVFLEAWTVGASRSQEPTQDKLCCVHCENQIIAAQKEQIMKLYKVDDGAVHWILAKREEEALGLWLQNVLMIEGEWPTEKPAIQVIPDNDTFTYVTENGGKVVQPARWWCVNAQGSEYLACSEF